MIRRSLSAAVLGAAFGVVAAAGMVGSALDAPQVGAQDVNRAVVTVGGDARCVEFTSESITGLQALQMAGFSPVVRGFSGEGAAVCAIQGLGCPADSSCLTCRAPNYWAYHRATPGAGGFAYSSVGAGSTTVTDGSVEGWQWGTGAPPSFPSFDAVCPLPQATTTTTTSTPRPGGGNGGAPGGGPQGGGGPTGSGDGPPPPADGPAEGGQPGASTTTVAPTTTRVGERGGPAEGGQATSASDDPADPELDGEDAAAVSPLDDDGGGPGLRTVLAFVALLGGFAFAGWRIRRIRTRGS